MADFSVPPATASTSFTPTSAAETAGASGLTSDFETFLRMLTAQARYQDPLEPMDSAEYAAQLAQFSMVEQQVRTNEVLQQLVANAGQSELSSLANWIGREVRSPLTQAYAGASLAINPTLSDQAQSGIIVVRDQAGVEQRRITFAHGDGQVLWDGMTDDGQPAPFGRYSFDVENWRDGAMLDRNPLQSYATVTEALRDGSETNLVLSDGRNIASDRVTGVRGGA
jgi:flagellar basal-body rod modification protein FlgD